MKNEKVCAGNVVMTLTERRIFGTQDLNIEIVIEVVGYDITYCINYPLGKDADKLKERYPNPIDYLAIFSIPELEALRACDITEFKLYGFEAIYSEKEIKKFHKDVAPFIQKDERDMIKVFYAELDPQDITGKRGLKKAQA